MMIGSVISSFLLAVLVYCTVCVASTWKCRFAQKIRMLWHGCVPVCLYCTVVWHALSTVLYNIHEQPIC
jgi:hypothetical protein